MRKLYYILSVLFSLVLFGCNNSKKYTVDTAGRLLDNYFKESRQKKVKRIEADLDCFIKNYPKVFFYPSLDSDSLNLLCSFSAHAYSWEDSFGCDYDYKERNVVEIRIDRNDNIRFEYQKIQSLDEVKDTLRILFTNPLGDERLAQTRLKKIDIIGERKVAKTSFIIDALVVPDSTGKASSWGKIYKIVNVIFEVNMDLRLDSAISIFNKEYDELSYLEQKALSELLPVAIWIYPNEEYGITYSPYYK